MSRYPLTALLAVALLAAAPGLGQTRTLDENLALADGDELRVDMKVGSLHIEASDTGLANARVELKCKRGKRCEERFDEVELVSRKTSRGLEIRLEVPSSRRGNDLQVEIQLTVPRMASLDVDLGVGEVDIHGSEGDVKVDLGVGEVEVNIAETAVATVKLDTGVGDAKLQGGGHGDHGSRGFVGKKVTWRQGTGQSAVHVDVGVGEIKVRLD